MSISQLETAPLFETKLKYTQKKKKHFPQQSALFRIKPKHSCSLVRTHKRFGLLQCPNLKLINQKIPRGQIHICSVLPLLEHYFLTTGFVYIGLKQIKDFSVRNEGFSVRNVMSSISHKYWQPDKTFMSTWTPQRYKFYKKLYLVRHDGLYI